MELNKKAASLLHLRGKHLEAGDPIAHPINLTTTYHLPGSPEGLPGYGRADNPTWDALETALQHLEGAETVVFPSGMAAITAAAFAVLKAGDSVLIPSDGYYVTRLLAENFLAPLGVMVETCPTREYATRSVDKFAAVFIETPSNPGLDVVDLQDISERVHKAGGLVIVDNTTLTPYGMQTLNLGADLVVASDTKAPAGHSDVLLGHVSGHNAELMHRVREWRKISGSIPGPHETWLGLRSLETLELRLTRMCESAQIIAERLYEHKTVKNLRYPGLKQDASYEIAQKQMQLSGFLIGFELSTGEAADQFINNCECLSAATSFGSIHSSAERRIRWGDEVAPGFVRLSIGIEPTEALWDALKASLDAL